MKHPKPEHEKKPTGTRHYEDSTSRVCRRCAFRWPVVAMDKDNEVCPMCVKRLLRRGKMRSKRALVVARQAGSTGRILKDTGKHRKGVAPWEEGGATRDWRER